MAHDGRSGGVLAEAPDLINLRRDARLLKLALSPRSHSVLAGNHGSRFRGRGMEFSESRIYQAGDDVRHIDWRVTARTGTTHTKLFVEERERPVFIVIDFSPSIYFGTRKAFKSVTAARTAALLAWVAVQQGDRVGGVLVTSKQVFDLKPKAGRRGALALIQALVQATEPPVTAADQPLLTQALQHIASVAHPGALIFLMSDFYHIEHTSENLLSRIRAHNDVVAIMLTDPIERHAPAAGHYAISNGSRTAYLNTAGKPAQARYRQLFTKRRQAVSALASQLDISLIMLENGEEISSVVQQTFGSIRNQR